MQDTGPIVPVGRLQVEAPFGLGVHPVTENAAAGKRDRV